MSRNRRVLCQRRQAGLDLRKRGSFVAFLLFLFRRCAIDIGQTIRVRVWRILSRDRSSVSVQGDKLVEGRGETDGRI
ncbi:hypothetical protein JQX14_01535 [Sulfitobacter pseudonitzschiae]|uniref:Uncharacterized protein n=1 Tax=Pseudosulfitobacter pseudonitzschiae TaxID=1402135 RepID=A0A9Q2NKM0_9RHOB|nr:hypothetical protein [Pseudosulfitobacter pseudonitzschiae]